MGYQLATKKDNPHWPMPPDYGDVTADRKRSMRLALLRGWYDPEKPGELMSDKDVFRVALNYFVDFYFKKSEACGHQYFLPDCGHKSAMQEMFTRPRSAMVAPRESGKTFTCVFELAPFLSVTRPNTPGLIGSETKELTDEKLKEIRRRIEGNGRIYADFGMVYNKNTKGSGDWNSKCLDFCNGSSIRGSSVDSATRGRHPIWGIIDDPEGRRSANRLWRDKFMDWLFRDYLNQFRDAGTHVIWIGTLLRMDSCLWRAIHNDDEERRFIAWDRRILKMVYEDDSGKTVSAWPEKLSIEHFERKKCGQENEDGTVTPIGLAAVMAEFQGEPMPAGCRMFCREERRHGYVWCQNAEGNNYLYDASSGKTKDLDELLNESFKYAGVDVSDTPSAGADPSAIVVFALDPDGIYWVLDAWEGRVFSDKTAIEAMRMAHQWNVSRMGWEAVALSKRIYREVVKLRHERHTAGFHVPVLLPLTCGGLDKALRIERMRPDFDAGLFRFPVWREIDGHVPAPHPHAKHLKSLLDQVDTMTGEGTAGHDDLLDAMEMAHRIVKGKPRRARFLSPGQRIVKKWENKGLEINPLLIDRVFWTEKMEKDFVAHTQGKPEKAQTVFQGRQVYDAFS